MRAYISGPFDAFVLLRGLEERAGSMADYCTGLNGQAASRNGKPLRLMKTVDGRPTYVTISRYDKRTLVASLNNEEGLVAGTAKRCLAAFLIPLVTEYVGTQDSEFTTGDRVRIVFEANGKRPRGKRCILFAEAAANQFLLDAKPGTAHRVNVPTSKAKCAGDSLGQIGLTKDVPPNG